MRRLQLDAFLTRVGWGHAQRESLAGDASARRYERLRNTGTSRPYRTAILMDAPPETGEDIALFAKLARHLRSLGLSAPEILAEDPALGALLLEDLGDDVFARVLEKDPAQELTLYLAAADALLAAQRGPLPPGLTDFDPREMSQKTDLICQWYLPVLGGPENCEQDLVDLLQPRLEEVFDQPSVLVLRDFHAENLIWLPGRRDVANVGLLDFQDAVLGHPAYDLASLLRDARRDVNQDVQDAVIEHFLSTSGYAADPFRQAFAVCSLQRNLRIMGVFTRLCVRDGKAHYPELMPRLWHNIQCDLAYPALADLAAWVHDTLPAPTPENIDRIQSQMGTRND